MYKHRIENDSPTKILPSKSYNLMKLYFFYFRLTFISAWEQKLTISSKYSTELDLNSPRQRRKHSVVNLWQGSNNLWQCIARQTFTTMIMQNQHTCMLSKAAGNSLQISWFRTSSIELFHSFNLSQTDFIDVLGNC